MLSMPRSQRNAFTSESEFVHFCSMYDVKGCSSFIEAVGDLRFVHLRPKKSEELKSKSQVERGVCSRSML